ncbi:MAG: hypothetical protein JNK82_35370 [Myxococcaceae bacterium]|nr:hypothetical protein [Myxococcaceae bacterium]
MRFSNLRVAIPPDWSDGSLYTFVAPSRVGGVAPVREFRSNVVFQSRALESGEGLEQCVERVKAHLVELYGQLQIEANDGPRLASGPSRRLSYTVTNKGSPDVAQSVYVFIVGETEWQAAFSATARNLSESLPQWEAIVASVQLVGTD